MAKRTVKGYASVKSTRYTHKTWRVTSHKIRHNDCNIVCERDFHCECDPLDEKIVCVKTLFLDMVHKWY
jgi:hypothetical protein